MRATFVVMLFAISAFAQDQAAIIAAESACGPKNVNFDARQDTIHHPTSAPETGKALVYVVEDLGQCPDCAISNSFADFFNNVNRALTKVGIDGSWMGANRGNSYISFPAEPGEHHLCINWQSQLDERSHAFAMANFTAEEGKVYYFRERLFPGHSGDFSFDLDSVNMDEGKYLVATSAFSVSHVKK